MFGPIQFGGLASGLDTASIIQALVGAEAIPIQQLQSQKAAENAKIELFGTLEGLLDTLTDKANDFKAATGFVSNSVTIAEEGVASFDSQGGSALGSYSLNVLQLASVDRYVTNGVADANEVVAGGIEASFTFGGVDYNIDLQGADATMNNLAEEIEEATGGEVQTAVIQTGTTGSPDYKLTIEGGSTGVDNAISGLAINAGGVIDVEEQLSTASNAIIELNGLQVEREGNEFAGVVEGLTFTVESVTTDGPVDFSISVDEEGVVEKLTEFVDAYNAAVDFIKTQNTYTEEAGAGGPLFGESALRSIQSAMSGALYSPELVDGTSAFGSLGLVGIDVNADGTLDIDETAVKEKLAEDPDAFADFFVDNDGFDNGGALEGTAEYFQDTTTDTGLFAVLERNLDRLLESTVLTNGDSAKGLLDSRKETLEKNVSRYDDRIEGLEYRLEKYEETLVQQYAALEQLLGGLQAQGNALTALNPTTT